MHFRTRSDRNVLVGAVMLKDVSCKVLKMIDELQKRIYCNNKDLSI